MQKVRIIPRLDIKNNTVVKGIQLEGLRVVGRPNELALKYYVEGADELLYIDVVASLYERNSLRAIIREAAREIFIPLTVGGGIRCVDDIAEILSSGADKVAINTQAIKTPHFLSECAERFGSQCIVLSVEAKRIGPKKWEAYSEGGREKTGIDVCEWVMKACQLGIGEVLLTSVDRDGTRKGFDLELVSEVASFCPVPLIVSGGVGKVEHLSEVLALCQIDAVAVGSCYHYNLFNIKLSKQFLRKTGFEVRL